jgi:hypothetical protein
MKSQIQNTFEVLLWNSGMDYELDKNTLYFGNRGTNFREEGYVIVSDRNDYLWEIGLRLLKEHLNEKK